LESLFNRECHAITCCKIIKNTKSYPFGFEQIPNGRYFVVAWQTNQTNDILKREFEETNGYSNLHLTDYFPSSHLCVGWAREKNPIGSFALFDFNEFTT